MGQGDSARDFDTSESIKPKLCSELSYTIRRRDRQQVINLPLSFGQRVQEPGGLTARVLDRFHFVKLQQKAVQGQAVLLHIGLELFQKICLNNQSKK